MIAITKAGYKYKFSCFIQSNVQQSITYIGLHVWNFSISKVNPNCSMWSLQIRSGTLKENTKTTSMEDVSTGILDKNEEYLGNTDKAKNDMMYQDIYNSICQNTKKWRYTIRYAKPIAQLVFKNRFPKGGPTSRRQVVNPRQKCWKDNQLQSLKLPCRISKLSS